MTNVTPFDDVEHNLNLESRKREVIGAGPLGCSPLVLKTMDLGSHIYTYNILRMILHLSIGLNINNRIAEEVEGKFTFFKNSPKYDSSVLV